MTSQAHYIESLKSLTVPRGKSDDDSELADAQLQADYQSVLGSVAFTAPTRADALIYIQALQRRGHAPRLVDCRRLNVLVRYLKKAPVGIFHRKVAEPRRLIAFSDSAFKAQEEESSGLALRGIAVLLTTADCISPTSKDGACQLIDYLTRKLKRVVRSTFAAEYNALLDSIEHLLLLQLTLHQLWYGAHATASQLMQILESGQLLPRVEIAIDAKSVYDALCAPDISTPQEAGLKLHLLAVRDRLSKGILHALHWVDTRDMLGDPFYKGHGAQRANRRRNAAGDQQTATSSSLPL